MLAVRVMGGLVALALALTAPAVHAECSKVTAAGPCSRTGKSVHARSSRPGARSPGLVLGGVGIELVAVGTLLLAAGMRAASCGEYDPRPCIGWEPVVLTLLAGTGLAATGAGMIYYGALDAPPQPRQPTAALPWTPRPPRGLSLTFRF